MDKEKYMDDNMVGTIWSQVEACVGPEATKNQTLELSPWYNEKVTFAVASILIIFRLYY